MLQQRLQRPRPDHRLTLPGLWAAPGGDPEEGEGPPGCGRGVWRQRGSAPAAKVALERALTEEALSASPEAQAKPSEGDTLLWLLRVLLPVFLVIVGFFAVLACGAYFFGAP